MIVREIKTDPVRVLKQFDWFNDYKDTVEWAARNCNDSVVTALQAGHEAWRAQGIFEFLLTKVKA